MKTRLLILTLFAICVFSVISVTFAEEIEPGPIDETQLCGGDAVLIDGVCQVIITHNVSIFSNKGFITFLIILSVLIPISIGLVVYWRKIK